MKIAIDARFLTHPQPGGFKTYTTELITALAQVDSENEYILYLDRQPDEQTALPQQPNFSFRVVSGAIPLFGMPWREQIGLTRQVARDKPDVFHSPSLTAPLRLSCPLVVTIHDMIWLFPERFSNGKAKPGKRKFMNWYYRSIPQKAAQNAASIITVSEASKRDIEAYMDIPETRIFVTYEGASNIYEPIDNTGQLAEIKQKRNLPEYFILAIGSADPRKNISRLIAAYAGLPDAVQEQYHLAIVWTHNLLAPVLSEQIASLNVRPYIHFLEKVSDQELSLLYNAAALFVFPSLYEGFGLPPLEAMACGTPVIAANNSSIPEIVGDAAILFDEKDVKALTDAIETMLNDDEIRLSYSQTGLTQAKRFLWARCAQETIQVYRSAIQK